MKTRRYYVALVLMTIAAFVVMYLNYRLTTPRRQPVSPNPAAAAGPESAPVVVGAATPPRPENDNRGADAAPTPTTPAGVQTQMETVKFLVRDYRAAFGGNPVGNNAEITKALRGANPRQTKFVVPGNSHVNATGELCDPWGTPYFFHALSAREMEIHSAGPDRKMWSSDDIVLR